MPAAAAGPITRERLISAYVEMLIMTHDENMSDMTFYRRRQPTNLVYHNIGEEAKEL